MQEGGGSGKDGEGCGVLVGVVLLCLLFRLSFPPSLPLLCPSLLSYLQGGDLVLQDLAKHRRHLHLHRKREGRPIPELEVGTMHRLALLPFLPHLEAEGLGRDARSLRGHFQVEIVGALKEKERGEGGRGRYKR